MDPKAWPAGATVRSERTEYEIAFHVISQRNEDGNGWLIADNEEGLELLDRYSDEFRRRLATYADLGRTPKVGERAVCAETGLLASVTKSPPGRGLDGVFLFGSPHPKWGAWAGIEAEFGYGKFMAPLADVAPAEPVPERAEYLCPECGAGGGCTCRAMNGPYGCTKPSGHDGPHRACSTTTHAIRQWVDLPAPEPKREEPARTCTHPAIVSGMLTCFDVVVTRGPGEVIPPYREQPCQPCASRIDAHEAAVALRAGRCEHGWRSSCMVAGCPGGRLS